MDQIAYAPGEKSIPLANDACGVYDVFRKYIVHEDDLVHQRITWAITIQSFAMAALGLVIPKMLDGNSLSTYSIQHYCLPLICFFCFLGFGVSFISVFSVLAAQIAIRRLQIEWNANHLNEMYKRHLPQIVGGGSPRARHLGNSLAWFLPAFLAVLWLAMFGYFLIEWGHPSIPQFGQMA